MASAICYQNKKGRRKWQPSTTDGLRMWRWSSVVEWKRERPRHMDNDGGFIAVLYKSQKKAISVAQRREQSLQAEPEWEECS